MLDEQSSIADSRTNGVASLNFLHICRNLFSANALASNSRDRLGLRWCDRRRPRGQAQVVASRVSCATLTYRSRNRCSGLITFSAGPLLARSLQVDFQTTYSDVYLWRFAFGQHNSIFEPAAGRHALGNLLFAGRPARRPSRGSRYPWQVRYDELPYRYSELAS